MEKEEWTWTLMHIFAVGAILSFAFYELISKIVGNIIATIGVLGMCVCALYFVKQNYKTL